MIDKLSPNEPARKRNGTRAGNRKTHGIARKPKVRLQKQITGSMSILASGPISEIRLNEERRRGAVPRVAEAETASAAISQFRKRTGTAGTPLPFSF